MLTVSKSTLPRDGGPNYKLMATLAAFGDSSSSATADSGLKMGNTLGIQLGVYGGKRRFLLQFSRVRLSWAQAASEHCKRIARLDKNYAGSYILCCLFGGNPGANSRSTAHCRKDTKKNHRKGIEI